MTFVVGAEWSGLQCWKRREDFYEYTLTCWALSPSVATAVFEHIYFVPHCVLGMCQSAGRLDIFQSPCMPVRCKCPFLLVGENLGFLTLFFLLTPGVNPVVTTGDTCKGFPESRQAENSIRLHTLTEDKAQVAS